MIKLCTIRYNIGVEIFSMIKQVVFDIDETIANTTHLVPKIINEVLEYFDKPT